MRGRLPMRTLRRGLRIRHAATFWSSQSKVSDGRIEEIRFRAKGCVAAMACGSALTELVRGKTVDEARKLSREELVRAVGGLPAASSHAGHLAMDALGAVLGKLAWDH